MKASMHNGRCGSARHNDRSFLRGRDAQEVAPHIDTDRTADNSVHTVGKNKHNLEHDEMTVYRNLFSDALQAVNSRYIKQGHSERCKTIEDLYRGRQTRPEEVIYQIGNADASVSADMLQACYVDYMHRLSDWNKAHGSPMIFLNYAVHVDETTAHVHSRRIWVYRDKEGHCRLGQNRALKVAGVPLPHPDKPEGRYNNRKMQFDRMARQMWIETCRDHGIEIDDVPAQRVQHKDKQEYMASKIADLQHKLDKYEQLERNHPKEFARMRQRDRGMTRFER